MDLIEAARTLAKEADELEFSDPVAYVYNPLDYAWEVHRQFLEKYGSGRREIVFLGMNPGPWGMGQTGIPFGDVEFCRDWMGLDAEIGKPEREHPKRPILGWECHRREGSGKRLWGCFRERWKTADRFFARHFIVNYCPLCFLEEGGKNRTPDKLKKHEREALFEVCNRHLLRAMEALDPKIVIAIGNFAEGRAKAALGEKFEGPIDKVTHPSPANPAANKGWCEGMAKVLSKYE